MLLDSRLVEASGHRNHCTTQVTQASRLVREPAPYLPSRPRPRQQRRHRPHGQLRTPHHRRRPHRPHQRRRHRRRPRRPTHRLDLPSHRDLGHQLGTVTEPPSVHAGERRVPSPTGLEAATAGHDATCVPADTTRNRRQGWPTGVRGPTQGVPPKALSLHHGRTHVRCRRGDLNSRRTPCTWRRRADTSCPQRRPSRSKRSRFRSPPLAAGPCR